MSRILCFGEILLRFSPDTEGGWLARNSMPVHIGGAELNVATALAKWSESTPGGQWQSAYCTAVPNNYLGRQLITYLQSKNIDASPVQLYGNRVGLYYLPQGLDVKNAGVIYDRAASSFAELQTGVIDWDALLRDVSWFHFSAIGPALSQSAADVCKEALRAARAKGITISLDLNYRAKLWQYGKKPSDIMPALAQYCDLIMGNVWAAETMLKVPIDPDLSKKDIKELYLQQAMLSSEEIMRQYPSCKSVANTFRFDHTGTIRYYTALYTAGQLHVSKEYVTDAVIDKVGSGDCFMAGLIYGHVCKWDARQIIEFATAAAFKKLFIKGDATTSSVEEIKSAYSHYV
ncbi:MAG TPA: sugar kinase [Chitinophagaceae bacterium]|nr:sugar kinase [Chitinophagaceae bacterium]